MQLSLDNLGLTPVSPVAPLTEAVRTVLSKYGSDAHLYIAGPNGLPINGFQPGNYFDSSGTTHASVDGSVGLVLDAAGSVGAELVTNGDFSSGTIGWNLGVGYSISSGKLIATASSANGDYAFTYSSGKTYRVTYTIDSITGNVSVNLGGAPGTVRNTAGTYSELITTVDALSFVRVQSRFGTASFVVDNVSVKEVTGIHATQGTPGYKPTLRKGIVNLLTYSNDLTNAVWLRAGSPVITPTSFARTASSASYIANTTTPAKPAVALPYTAATVASAGSGRYVSLRLQGSYPSRVDAVFDLQNGVVVGGYPTVSGTFASPSASIVSLGSGQYLCGVSAVSDTYLGITPFISFNSAGVQVDGTDSMATSSGNVYGSGLFAGTLTAAQILAAGGIPLTTTAPASSQAGVNYLALDGVDDRLALAGPLFQMGDDHCVVAAAMKSSVDTASPGIIAVEGTGTDLIGLTFSAAKVQYFLNAGGVASYRVSNSDYQSTSIVVTGRKVGTSAVLRVNGVQQGAALSTSATGGGAMTSATIGRQSYGGVPAGLKGNIHCVLAIKGTVSDADLAVLEKFVAQLSGVQL